ncbi:MAG: valine--tRNA ligase [Bacteroidetes bacterium]|nr:valine--tRNA ligase [Bacteroidota bacterium]
MEIPKQYNPGNTEDKWYTEWLKNNLFRSTPDEREPFTIVIPPPNVTGVLHMGHMLNNTIQDVLIRRARMQGKNACWVPGTDHASIATEAKVVAKLKAEGIDKNSLSRVQFLEHAWAWKEKHGGIILDQLKKLGAACDWERTKFTMDSDLSDAVTDTFIRLYKEGLIYRGVRMVNWDPSAQTAVSDEEVIYKENPGKLFHVKYLTENGSDSITIATTRPETILGDTAICVHPDDSRYSAMIGKTVLVPLINRPIKIIADEYVDMTFGSGALKITPAHDINDYQLGIKHKLEVIDVIAADGTMSEAATLFVGEDRFKARKLMVKALEDAGQLVKTEEIINKVGHSERTDAVIEPRLSLQWFVDMKQLAGPALEAVTNGSVQLHPSKFINTYRYWMENVKDWCISRQLWWGHRIPAWYYNNEFVVASSADEAVKEFAAKGIIVSTSEIKQDEDVVDTWFSSWLWPITVFDAQAIRKSPDQWNEDLKYYYPTNDLVTAPEILFFWVARMIMAGIKFAGDIPFKNVYLTGIVRDKQGRKMSKSLGNSPDPLMLIEKFGADGVRIGMLLTSPAGNDLPFDDSLCEQGRNFNNKLWNAFRLLQSWEVSDIAEDPAAEEVSEWFVSRIADEKLRIDDLFEKYRISEALMALYKLVWDDYCSWYLEAVKPGFGSPVSSKTKSKAASFMKDLLCMVHPFAPFITEEIWSFLRSENEEPFILLKQESKFEEPDPIALNQFELTRELISAIRNFRSSKGLSPKDAIHLVCRSRSAEEGFPFKSTLLKLANLSDLEFNSDKSSNGFSIMVRTDEFFIAAGEQIDLGDEKEKLEKDLEYYRGFLISVSKKLSNEKFVANAKPEIVENERKKEADAVQKIKLIEEQLKALGV